MNSKKDLASYINVTSCARCLSTQLAMGECEANNFHCYVKGFDTQGEGSLMDEWERGGDEGNNEERK